MFGMKTNGTACGAHKVGTHRDTRSEVFSSEGALPRAAAASGRGAARGSFHSSYSRLQTHARWSVVWSVTVWSVRLQGVPTMLDGSLGVALGTERAARAAAQQQVAQAP